MDHDAVMDAQLARLDKLGGPAFVRKMVRLFLDIVPQRLASIEQGLRTGDLPAVEQAAHALKSSAGNLGAVVAQELCEQMEGLAGAGKSDSLPALLEQLRQSLEQAVARLQPIGDAAP